MSPDDVGWKGDTIVLGKLSGRAGLKQRLTELGHELDENDLSSIFVSFKRIADTKSEITDDDLQALVEARYRKIDVTRDFVFQRLSMSANSMGGAKVALQLKTPSGTDETVTIEDAGPVNAIFKAIAKITNCNYKLVEYSVSAATEGVDAIGEATVRLRKDDTVYTGRGSDIDVLVASAKAYVNAINRAATITAQSLANGKNGKNAN
jgi:2-isopropylmalate synthase